ncbi:MAG: class I SAM-dependent methyltransferase [Chloroflexota bacterium]|nr:class I SAM-dependent methyltransferase [Chloroflexota bacterium]
MRRLQLFEIEDQWWCPSAVRDAATDYLGFVQRLSHPYGSVAPRLLHALERVGTRKVLDLGSGGGGPWPRLVLDLADANYRVHVRLTDRFPNAAALARVRRDSEGILDVHPRPVDARQVPPELDGFCTLFSTFHHLRSEDARAVLRNAMETRRGIGVFEATHRSPGAILAMTVQPLFVLVLTPFIRPFRWSRLLLTYLVPVVPAVVLFDGVVSSLRTYTSTELQELTAEIGNEGYVWEMGELAVRRSPIPITYLIGYPVTRGLQGDIATS